MKHSETEAQEIDEPKPLRWLKKSGGIFAFVVLLPVAYFLSPVPIWLLFKWEIFNPDSANTGFWENYFKPVEWVYNHVPFYKEFLDFSLRLIFS